MSIVPGLLLIPAAAQNAKTTQNVAKFESCYDVSVEWQRLEFPVAVTGGRIAGNDSGKDGEQYLPTLIREFSVYHGSFIRRSQLKRIVVCKDLAVVGQRRATIPDFSDNTLYLDCERGRHSATYQRAVIHHEFFAW